jgi:hypothetical protein
MISGAAAILVGSLLVFCAINWKRPVTFNWDHENENVSVKDVMAELAQSYFPQVVLDAGVTAVSFRALTDFAMNPDHGRGVTMLVQAIDGKIWVDRTKWTTHWAWDNMRAQWLLEELRIYMKSDAGRQLPNFEFLLNPFDCPLRNCTTQGPIFTVTRCHGAETIPIPQWFAWRDGAFGAWDAAMAKSWLAASQVPWDEKQSRAVFYGAIRKSSLVKTEDGRLSWTNLSLDNWDQFGRGKLYKLAKDHPDLLEVGLQRASSVNQVETFFQAMAWEKKPYMTMEAQAKQFKYAVYLEGNCGWADRLKNQLALGMVLFVQETPCQEFFAPLLVPWVHYIPIKNDLSDLLDLIRWAQANDDSVREISANAAEFAKEYLSTDSWRIYLRTVFDIYAGLMRYQPSRRPNTKRFRGSFVCPNQGNSKCNVDWSFVDK